MTDWLTQPPAVSSFPLYDAVRQCRSCRLSRGCVAPVPGVGRIPNNIMIVGESPGATEDEVGIPFVGQTGRLLSHLLEMAGLQRLDVYLTNITKCVTVNDAPPNLVAFCAREWLDGLEMQLVKPKIIVAMGQAAIRHVLGDNSLTVEHTHGIPVYIDSPAGPKSILVFPTYNPAAGLRNTNQLRPIWEDWRVFGRILNEGVDPSNFVPVDQYPEPSYEIVERESHAREILHLPEYALDTETVPVRPGEGGRSLVGASALGVGSDPTGRPHRLWSVQVSNHPGQGFFIPAELIPDPGTAIPPTSTVYVHNYLYDRQFIRIPTYIDTMVAAYLLGLPQGLKALAYRLCGMEMHSYSEYVQSGAEATRMAMRYLGDVLHRESEWPMPELLSDDKWDNKTMTLATVTRTPQPIVRKVGKWFMDWQEDPNIDLVKRWQALDLRERKYVEAAMGPMPEPSLADIDPRAAYFYSARDADATWRVKESLMREVENADLSYIFHAVDLPVLAQISEMMDTGIAVDLDYLRALSAYYLAKLKISAAECARLGERGLFNPNSPTQVADILYKRAPEGLGFPVTRYTRTGKASTDDRELKKVEHPVVDEILSYRGLLKAKTAYADTLVARADPGTNRIHATIRATRTETGRLAMTGPNLMAIPVRKEESKLIRKGFVAPNGRMLLAADYSQIEMRVLAHFTRAPYLLELFLAGLDMHTYTASLLFRVPYDEAAVTKYRYPAKTVNFSIVYGITAIGLYEALLEGGIEGWSLDDCSRLLATYDAMFPEVQEFRREQERLGTRLGYVSDLLGRRRYIPELVCPIPRIRSEGSRMAGNMPIQSTAQDIIKLAGNRIWHLRETGRAPVTDFKFLLQVHDELIFELGEDDVAVFGAWIKETMESVLQLAVPVVADVRSGKNWGDMESLVLGEAVPVAA